MITIKYGDLFDSNCQTLVNTVNCRGVMGKGIALRFKKLYPRMFMEYQFACVNHDLMIGKCWLWKGDKWVLNFPTKLDWRNPSQLAFIEAGLNDFVAKYKEMGITSIAFPMLGCNNGGLDVNEVLPIMKKYLGKLDIDIEIYIAGMQHDLYTGMNLFNYGKA